MGCLNKGRGRQLSFIDCSPDAGHTHTHIQTDGQTYAFAKINLLCSVLKSCISDSSIMSAGILFGTQCSRNWAAVDALSNWHALP